MSKIVVTGGAGFVGSHAAEHFSNKGDEVVVCDNLSRAKTLGVSVQNQSYNWQYLKKIAPTISLYETDLRNFPVLHEVVRGANLIVHTAGQVALTTSVKDPRSDFENNVLGTFNTLEAARLNDAAIVFCSTNKVYGDNVNTIPVGEEETRYTFNESYKEGIGERFSIDHTRHSPYGASKLASDIYVQDYGHTYGLKTAVFRMSCIYGERQFGVEDQGWLAWFTIATLTGKTITIYGDGKQVRDVLYIKDLIAAFDQFVKSGIKHEVFNIGGGPGNTLSLLELLDRLQAVTGKRSRVVFDDWRPADQKVYISDIRRAKEILGWRPKVGPDEGIERLVNWIGTNSRLFL